MPELAFALLMVPIVVAFTDWRKGLALCVVVALLQDPLRKLTPGQPVYFVVFTGIVFAAAWAAALMARVRLSPGTVQGWRHYLGTPFQLFVVLVVVQAGHALVRYGNPMVPAIGLLSYFAALPAIVFAYQFAFRRGLGGVRGWMWFYAVVTSIALVTVYLDYLELGWPGLGEVGEGLYISGLGGTGKAYSGTFRSSEIAAWHVATTACFMFMLFIGRKFTVPRILLSVGLTIGLLGVGLLTGRRKMLVEVCVFVCAYFFLSAWFRNRATRVAIMAAIAGLVTFVIVVGMVPPDPGEFQTTEFGGDANLGDRYREYTERGQSVFADIPARFANLGIAPVAWAIEGYGLLGAGLGSASQGTYHFTGNFNTGASEGGLGKITLELGLPGLLLCGWLLIALGRYVHRVLEVTAKASLAHSNLAFGLVAFLLANLAAFSVATQVYGDVFVLMLLGWAVGFLLAMPGLALSAARARQPDAQPRQPAAPGAVLRR